MKTITRPNLACSLYALLAIAAVPLSGCAYDASDLDVEDELVEESEAALESKPATCQEIKAAHPSLGDGEYTLYLNHDPAKPWKVHCAGMASSPAEYLKLKNVGPSANFSQYTAGGAVWGTNVRTQYTRLRIDPMSLNVHIGDQTFATSTGQLTHGSESVTSMPFGTAMSCDAGPSGVANIDLTGTAFAVAADEFVQGGYYPSGTSTYSGDRQVVDLTGGGYCGWTTTTPGGFNPFNQVGGFQLQLEYRHPATCQEIKSIVSNAWDGHYTLFIGHDPSKPWKAYCFDMAGTPAEYLTLNSVGPSANFSQYTAGGAAPGTNVRTQYTKVRIDPATLNIDIGDQTFATSTGELFHGGGSVTSMPFGVAMSCDAVPSGVANINLTGTPFAVLEGQFVQAGYYPSGSSAYSSNGRVVDITGGGYCGWTNPAPSLFNPFNQAGDFQLGLVFSP